MSIKYLRVRALFQFSNKAHARRDFADAVNAVDKKDPSSVRQSVAYQALQKIAEFYNTDTELKGLSSRERLQKRQEVIKPMVKEFFAWVKQQVSDCTVPPKSKTGQGLNFVINQEKYLQIFLEDGNMPIDNSASERAIRIFDKLNHRAPTNALFHPSRIPKYIAMHFHIL